MCILQCLSFLKYPNDKWKLYIEQIQGQKQEGPPTQQGDHAILQTEEILSNQLKADLHFVTPHEPRSIPFLCLPTELKSQCSYMHTAQKAPEEPLNAVRLKQSTVTSHLPCPLIETIRLAISYLHG